MKKTIAASLILLSLVGYGAWNRRVLIPGSKVSVRVRLFSRPRLWGNAVEFDHRNWQEICVNEDGKAKCLPLAKASPQ